MKIGITSKGIYNIPNLRYFFASNAKFIRLYPWSKAKVDVVLGWGNKQSGFEAREYAAKHNIPFYNLEDGFIRSLGPAKYYPNPLSLIKDEVGIYYDATQPSKLENLIIANEYSEAKLLKAKELIKQIKEEKLSKYNHSPDNTDLLQGKEDYILVLDQTYGDESIAGSMASKQSFKDMLEAAFDENPEAKVIIKTHPDVIGGFKQGYLAELGKKYNCQIIAKNINPWTIINPARKVYTVSSQMGFESLMAGKTVRCFGLPFYAGWGLTSDELSSSRRNLNRTLEEVFISSYFKYVTYQNPFTNEICDLEEIIPILGLWKTINEQNRHATDIAYISKWKQANIAKFTKSTNCPKPIFHANINSALPTIDKSHKLIAWASKCSQDDKAICKAKGVTLGLMEDGFLRSVGLGANLVTPQSIVIDYRGIYYDPNQPSDLEHLIQTKEFTPDLVQRADALIKDLNALNITKYNVATNSTIPIKLPKDKNKILVVGQVEDDASIRLGTRDIRNNLELLKEVRKAMPDAYIIYKPHPDVVAGHREGHIKEEIALKYANQIINDVSITELLQACDELHTLTSLSGFEALIRGKPVYCYGIPFYAGWGLTNDKYQLERRTRKISLNELVAATLILYPRYLDPVTELWCTPEIMVKRLQELKDKPNKPSLLVRVRVLLGRIKRIFKN